MAEPPHPPVAAGTWRLLQDALRTTDLRGRRERAIATLERTTAPVDRTAVAIALLPMLSEAPDIAARAHIAMIVLAPDLKVGRDEDGAFVGTTAPDLPSDGADGFLDRDVGRVVALDRLLRLFGPDDDPPLFLSPPARSAPRAYRSPEAVHTEALERLLAEKAAARAAYVERLALLGLEHDALDDDVDDAPTLVRPPRPLTQMPPITTLHDHDDITLVADDERHVLGRALPGTWWHEARVGDHRGARRFVVARRVEEHLPIETRRERRIAGGTIRIEIGPHVVQLDVDARTAVVFVDAVGDDVIAVAVAWSTSAAFKPKADPEPRPKPRPRL